MTAYARFALSFALAVGASNASASDGVQASWQSRYSSLAKALDSRNVAQFGASLAPDFVIFSDPRVKQRRASYLAGLDQLFSTATSAKNVAIVSQARQKDDNAVIVYRWTYHVLTARRNGATMVTATMTCADTWKRIHGKWLTVKSQTIKFGQTVDNG